METRTQSLILLHSHVGNLNYRKMSAHCLLLLALSRLLLRSLRRCRSRCVCCGCCCRRRSLSTERERLLERILSRVELSNAIEIENISQLSHIIFNLKLCTKSCDDSPHLFNNKFLASIYYLPTARSSRHISSN